MTSGRADESQVHAAHLVTGAPEGTGRRRHVKRLMAELIGGDQHNVHAPTVAGPTDVVGERSESAAGARHSVALRVGACASGTMRTPSTGLRLAQRVLDIGRRAPTAKTNPR